MKVLRRMRHERLITTAHVAALKTQAQMYPSRAGSQALRAAVGRAWRHAVDVIRMHTLETHVDTFVRVVREQDARSRRRGAAPGGKIFVHVPNPPHSRQYGRDTWQ